MQNAEKVIDNVKTMRDELKLKTHLFKMDAKNKWDDLEEEYKDVIAKVDKAKVTAGEVTDGVWTANKLAFHKIRNGYEQIKKDLS